MPSRVQIVIDVDADQAGQALGKVNTALGGMEAQARQTTTAASRGFGDFERSMFRAQIAAGVVEAALQSVVPVVRDLTVGSALLAAQDEARQRGLEALVRVEGRNIDLLRSELAQVEALGFSRSQAQRSLTLFTKAGIEGATAVDLLRRAEAAAIVVGRDLNETAERFTQGIVTARPELLDELGIKLRLETANKRYAQSIGTAASTLDEQEQALAVAMEVQRQSNSVLEARAQISETLEQRQQKLAAAAERAQIALGRNFQEELEQTIGVLESLLDFTTRNADQIVNSGEAVLGLAVAYGTLRLAIIGAQNAAAISSLFDLSALLGGLAGKVGRLAALFASLGRFGQAGLFVALAGSAGLAGFEIAKLLDQIFHFTGETQRAGVSTKGFNVTLKLNEEQVKRNREVSEEYLKSLRNLGAQLDKREFGLDIAGLDKPAQERAKAAQQVRELMESVERFPALVEQAERIREKIFADVERRIAEDRAKAQEEALNGLHQAISRESGAIAQIEARRDQELEKFRAIAAQYPELREQAARAQVLVEQGAADEIDKIHAKELADLGQKLEQQARMREAVLGQISTIERANQMARLNEFGRIEAERVSAIEAIEQDIERLRAAGHIGRIEAERQTERAREAINRQAGIRIADENQRIADEQARAWERNARDYEQFLDRMVRFTEQTGSLIGNIWKTMREEFQRNVTKMVFDWIFGLTGIKQAALGLGGGSRSGTAGTAGGGGGGLAGILLGGSVGTVGATPPFNPNQFAFNFAGGGFGTPGFGGGSAPAAGAGGVGSIPNAVPLGIPGGQNSSLPGLGQLPGGQGALLGLLLGLEGARRGRPLLAGALGIGGVLGGVALSGAAAGVAGGVGALSGIGIGLAGFLTNPVGLALLGGIALVSVIGGILARGKKKEAATDIANAGFAEIEEAVQSFSRRAASFEQTITAMNRVWQRMTEGWDQIGGSVGAESKRTQRPFFEAKIRQVELLEEARKTRLGFAEQLPIPEFEQGGFVPGRPGEPVLIRAHAGELVVPRPQAQAISTPRLDLAGSGGGGGTVNVTINCLDAADLDGYLKKNKQTFARHIIRSVRRDMGDFGELGRGA